MGLRPDIANPNPRTQPAWDTKSATAADTLRITTCKLCCFGVYKGQAKTWGNGIDGPIGWSHEACAQQGGSGTDG